MSRLRDSSRRNFLSSRQANDSTASNRFNITTTTSIKDNERTPLINSIGAASESLVMNKSSNGEIQTGVSWSVGTFLLVNTALGAGMLNYPYAYNQIGGILAASLMQVILLIFITSTMFILVYCADFNHDDTYHDVLLSMCGKRAQQISALSILLTCYGINITFLVIIGDQYDRIFASLLPDLFDEYWFFDRKFTIFITSILFILPMCYAKRLDFLRHASILGMFAMLYVAFLTVYEHYRLDEATIAAVLSRHLASESLKELNSTSTNASLLLSSLLPPISNSTTTTTTTNSQIDLTTSIINATTDEQDQLLAASFTTTSIKHAVKWFEPLAVIPVLCFAYQTHEVVVPVYACMKRRHVGSFMKSSIFCLIVLFILYNLVGAYGYLTFGEHVAADIMSLYDAQDPIVVVGIIALVIKFITTYPPLMFCGRTALDGLYGEMRKLSPQEFKSSEEARRYIITTLWFFSTVLLAIFAPDISVTLQLLGSMASINVFVFPGMCLVSLTMRLRRARLALLMGEIPDGQNQLQRAKDYYLISGSYFGSMKKSVALRRELNLTNQQQQDECCSRINQLNCSTSSATRPQQHFTATFASLVEFENNLEQINYGEQNNSNKQHCNNSQLTINGFAAGSSSPSASNGGGAGGGGHQNHNHQQTTNHKLNGYNSNQSRRQRRQEEFERLITSTGSNQDHQLNSSSFARPINDSLNDYSDCDDTPDRRHNYNHNHQQQQQQHYYNHQHKADITTSGQLSLLASSCLQLRSGCLDRAKLIEQQVPGFVSKDPSLDKLATTATGFFASSSKLPNQNEHHQSSQCLQNSWNNRSTTGSLLDRLGTSIAPSTVAQVGISRCVATGLYLYSGLLIIFGAFIFVLELVSVFGFL